MFNLNYVLKGGFIMYNNVSLNANSYNLDNFSSNSNVVKRKIRKAREKSRERALVYKMVYAFTLIFAFAFVVFMFFTFGSMEHEDGSSLSRISTSFLQTFMLFAVLFILKIIAFTDKKADKVNKCKNTRK